MYGRQQREVVKAGPFRFLLGAAAWHGLGRGKDMARWQKVWNEAIHFLNCVTPF